MARLINQNWSDETVNWLEADHQIAVVQMLKREGILFQADQSGMFAAKRTAAKAKLNGMQSGFPDLNIYLHGRVLMIEMKRWKGVTSKEQKDRHIELRELGYQVEIVKERTPADAVARVKEILDRI